MTLSFPPHVLELLSSHICHDLISPVSAVTNGVELMEELDSDMQAEAMSLIAQSAQNAARLLRMFRIAYGAGGSAEGVHFDDLRATADIYFAAGKVKIQWPTSVLNEKTPPATGTVKILSNVLMLADEALPYGGAVHVSGTADSIRVTATGRQAALRPDIQGALDGAILVDDLSPRNVHAYLTAQFAHYFGFEVKTQAVSTEETAFTIVRAA